MKCKSCGDQAGTFDIDLVDLSLTAHQCEIANTHCADCAKELLFGTIKMPRLRLSKLQAVHDAGLLEEETTPEQDDAVRAMEENRE